MTDLDTRAREIADKIARDYRLITECDDRLGREHPIISYIVRHVGPALREAYALGQSTAPAWRPIEECPAGLMRADLWQDGSRYADCIRFRADYSWWYLAGTEVAKRIHPTHFLPLPSPPSPQTGSEGP